MGRRVPSPSGVDGRRIRLLLVDLDDTLFDHVGSSRRALAILRRHHPPLRRLPMPTLLERYTAHLEALHPSVLSGELTIDAARIQRMVRLFAELGSPIDDAQARSLAAELRQHYQGARRPTAGARSFLRYARARARIAVVTNNLLEEQREKLEYLGLQGLVDDLVTSEEVGAAKPDPLPFLEAVRRSGLPKDSAVVLGDSWSSDVVGARSAGIPVVWFNRFGKRSAPDAAVPEVKSLLPPSLAWATLVRAHAEGRTSE